MSIELQEGWFDELQLDCGEGGFVPTDISAANASPEILQQNVESIVDHWTDIWPNFREGISTLMESYRQSPPDWTQIRMLYLELPDALISDESEWSVSVEFSASVTLWVLPFCGWLDLRNQAHAIW
ncbi:MAG: hypothetical protein HS117_19970 [Verrucomicrobiaceae bacterium]|nr:hypothetical protein [Verrucomicrobiaceae bacterium]